jgi:HD superfamily phosphodiesterase
MKTQEGARLAAQRHAFMEQFLDQFKAEWEGKA